MLAIVCIFVYFVFMFRMRSRMEELRIKNNMEEIIIYEKINDNREQNYTVQEENIKKIIPYDILIDLDYNPRFLIE